MALRVLRPGIAERIALESEIFQQTSHLIEQDPAFKGTPFEQFGMVWRRIAENVNEELRVELTARSQELFEQIYAPRPYLKTAQQGSASDLRVPKVYRSELARHGVLIQEFVEGMSFEKLARQDAHLASGAAHDFAEIWIREALFLSGWHHSDPHQGNLRVASPLGPRPQIYLLDYGMVGVLSPQQRSDLILLGYALQTRNIKAAEHHVSSLVGAAPAGLSRSDLIHKFVTLELTNPKASAPNLLSQLVSMGFELPRELVSFNRGYFMIQQLLRQNGSHESLEEMSRRMGRVLVGQDVMLRVVGWGRLPSHTLPPSPLTPGQLWKLAGRETQRACTRFLRSLMPRAGAVPARPQAI